LQNHNDETGRWQLKNTQKNINTKFVSNKGRKQINLGEAHSNTLGAFA
jgi:hypothetical protein